MAIFLFFFPLLPAWLAVRGGAEHGSHGECPGGAGCAGGERSPACPAGFFCPAGNGSVPLPVPCPPGTFGPAGAAGPSPGCQPCPAGSFSPRPGQSSCLPCGSAAAQPAEGQSTCVCPGPAQVYQPRDGLCTCPPGFRSSGRAGGGCAPRSYPVCRDSASRSPEGHCLTPRGWARYCSQKVCAAPEDFRGYDRVLGLCRCGSDSLEGEWSSGCREQQESPLQLLCAGRAPRLLITHSNGTQSAVALEGLRKVLPRPNFSLEDVCAAGQRRHPVHVVEMSGKGFLGVYNPDPEFIQALLGQGEASAPPEGNPPPAAAPGPAGPGQRRERPRSPKCPARGILNPLACGSGALSLLFLLSPEHFPLYDLDNLFNTNAEFDWGDFRSLREEIREIPPNSTQFLLFLFQFQAPGTYVLQLSSNKHKRMWVRVLPAALRCRPDGPFVAGSPRAALRAGLAPREPRLRPERPALGSDPALAIAIGIAIGILLLLALPLLCPAPGRVPRGDPGPGPGPGPDPPFRRRQLRHSLERFSSRIPAVIPRRKPRRCCSAAGAASSPGREEPWEPQLDLEGFSTQLFFELLLRQSQSVTTTLGRFKEEVKVVYHGVMREISWLKKLWVKALRVPAEEEEEAKEQAPLSGSQRPRTGGSSDSPGDPRDSIAPRLIPLLQTLLQALQEGRKGNSSPESPGPAALGQLLAARTLLLHPQQAETPLQAESQNHWLRKKNQNFLHLLSSGRQSLGQKAHPGEEAANSWSPSALEDEVDALTEELLRIVEDEEQFLNSQGNEDLLSYYLEITSLEKESLVTQIRALEEEIAQGRKL